MIETQNIITESETVQLLLKFTQIKTVEIITNYTNS